MSHYFFENFNVSVVVVVRCPHTAKILLMDGLTLLCFQHTDARSV